MSQKRKEILAVWLTNLYKISEGYIILAKLRLNNLLVFSKYGIFFIKFVNKAPRTSFYGFLEPFLGFLANFLKFCQPGPNSQWGAERGS